MTLSLPYLLKCCRNMFCIAIALVALSLHGRAQTGIYASFTASKVDAPDKEWIYGPTVGIYFDTSHFTIVELGVDIRGSFLGGGGATQVQSGLAGPRIVLRTPIIPIRPYAEGLLGVGHANIGQGVERVSQTTFEYQLLAGVDFTLIPHIDWRIVEFSYGSLSNFEGGLTPKSLSTGIVFRLPSL
jgi:hypothetical protein